MDAAIKNKVPKALLKLAISLAVFTFSLLFFNLAEAATLYLSPSTGTYTTGKNFTVSVRVSTNQSMNAADGVIHFPTDKVQVVGISKVGSIFNLWVQEPSYSNAGTLGNFRFEGVVLNPGFTGDGKIMDVTFQVRNEGAANAVFASGSVLANDGQGTNVVSALSGGTYNLQKSATQQPDVVLPTSAPPKPTVKHFSKAANGELVLFNTSENGTKWTNSPYAKLTWLVPGGTSGVTTLLNNNSDSNPGTKSEGLFDSETFSALGEGQHYFHARFLNVNGAGPIVHYPVFVDLTSPKPFKVEFTNKELTGTSVFTTSNPRISIEFAATDVLSGIDRYEVKIGSEEWLRTEVPPSGGIYVLTKQKPGTHQLIVRAIDKAGNFTDATAQVSLEPVLSPVITDYTKYLTSPGEKLFVEGTASSRASVEVKFMKGGETPIIVSIRADDSGNWQLVYDGVLESGSYRLTAKQILENGAESFETDPVRFGVNSLFWRIFSWILNIGGLLFVLLTIIVALLFVAYYYWHKVSMFRKRLRKEAREAEEALHHGISAIRKELEKGEPRSKIAKDLGALDKEVEKEIKDIEKQ